MQLESRPRWGILSTRAHLDPGALVSDILPFDRLVFPKPADDDVERWEELGWKPQAHTELMRDLGTLAHTVKWTLELQAEWKSRFDSLSQAAKDSDGAAYGTTPMV